MMKKIAVLLLLPLLILCSCGKKTVSEMSAGEIIDAVYQKVNARDCMKGLKSELTTEEITIENEEYYLGVTGVPYVSGAASEAVVQPVTYSFCVIRLKEGCDYDAERIKIENNINKGKWVCARADEAYVVRSGDLIAVIMGTKEACDGIEAAFLKIVK